MSAPEPEDPVLTSVTTGWLRSTTSSLKRGQRLRIAAVARQPALDIRFEVRISDAMKLRDSVGEIAEQLWVVVLPAIPFDVIRWIPQPEVGTQIHDDRSDSAKLGQAVHGHAMRQREKEHINRLEVAA